MEEFIEFEEITKPDPRHRLIDQITGTSLTLEGLYKAISNIELIKTVPEELQSQFNVTRNLAVYTWFSYSLDPVVQMKTYILIEHALRLKDNTSEWRFPRLIKKAINKGWIRDSGFSHIVENPEDKIEYCRKLIDVLPELRNSAAHGTRYH